ncbi:glycosyltransferase family 2 protein [Pseudomonadota bacterium]
MSNIPLITVCITAYQHEKFINETIGSVLSQKLDAGLEIIVGVQPFDNKDRTLECVYEMAAAYPEIIKVVMLPSDVKHIYMNGRKTGRANFLNTFSFAKGDYVCHLDGDDAYDRADKLQKQIDFLENNTEYVVVSHAIINEMDSKDRAVYWKKEPSGFALSNVCGGAYFHLSSCMYRNIFKGELPFDFTLPGTGDLYLLMQYLRFGKGFYFPILGSRYRVHGGGIYSGVGNRVKRKRMIRNLITYSNTGYFEECSELMLQRAKKISLVREYEIYCMRKKHAARICFLLNNSGFFAKKLANKCKSASRKLYRKSKRSLKLIVCR